MIGFNLAAQIAAHAAGYDWYFDGSDGCPTCQAMTGYYDAYPSRLHTACDCEIRAVNVFSGMDEEYRNPSQSSSFFDGGEDVLDEIDNYDGTGPVELAKTYSKTYSGSISVGVTIEEVFNVSSTYSESLTESKELSTEVPVGSGLLVVAYPVYEEIHFSVEVWEEGRHTRTIEDTITVVDRIRFEFESK